MEKTNAHVQVATVTQTASEVLGTKEKTLWFVIVETPVGKMQMNIGEKSYKELQRITAPREEKTVLNVLPNTK